MKYDELVRRGREAVKRLTQSQWELGDLALAVAPMGRRGIANGGAERLRRYADEIDVEYSSLVEYRRVAEAWPNHTRVLSVSWSAHRELASHEDRFALLREGMTLSEARRAAGIAMAGRSKPEAVEEAVRENPAAVVEAIAEATPEVVEKFATAVVAHSEELEEPLWQARLKVDEQARAAKRLDEGTRRREGEPMKPTWANVGGVCDSAKRSAERVLEGLRVYGLEYLTDDGIRDDVLDSIEHTIAAYQLLGSFIRSEGGIDEIEAFLAEVSD